MHCKAWVHCKVHVTTLAILDFLVANMANLAAPAEVANLPGCIVSFVCILISSQFDFEATFKDFDQVIFDFAPKVLVVIILLAQYRGDAPGAISQLWTCQL